MKNKQKAALRLLAALLALTLLAPLGLTAGGGRPGYHLHRFRQRFCELCEKLRARHLVGRKDGHPAGGYLSGRDGLHARGRLRRHV